MYNIKKQGRDDFLLGCSVESHAEATIWLKQYQQKYPTQAHTFSVVRTSYAGDMAQLQEDLKRYFTPRRQ